MPGIVSGVILVFIPCLGSFLTPDLLGGANAMMIGNVIERQFKAANDWPFGAALSFLLMYATFRRIGAARLSGQAQQGSGHLMAAQLKPGSGPLDYGNRLWLKMLFGVIFFLLYVPIITLVAFSFNTDKRGIVWRGFTLDNYVKAWNNGALIEAMINSLVIAFLATIIATIIGAMVALMLWRFRFPFKGAYEGFMALPIVIPEICMGVALLLFFNKTGMMGAIVSHAMAVQPRQHHHRPCGLLLSLCHRRGALAPRRLQPAARGSLEGPGRQRMADFLEGHRALHDAGPHRRCAAGLHAVAR